MRLSVWIVGGLLLSAQALAQTEKVIPSLSLVDTYKTALVYNQSLLSKQSQLDSEKEAIDQAWSEVLPNLSVSGHYGYGEYSTDFLKNESDNFNRRGVNLSQPLFSYRRFQGITKANESVRSAELEFKRAAFDTGLEAIEAYVDVLESITMVEISTQEVADHEIKMERLEAMLGRGMATKMDMLETTSKYDELKANLSAEKTRAQVVRKRLEQLIGVKYGKVEPVPEDMWERTESLLKKTDWVADAREHSILILAARQRLDEAQADVEVQIGEYWPEVTARAEYYDADSYENSITENAKVLVEVRMPIYEGGRTNSRVSASRSMVQSARHNVEDQLYFVEVKTEESLANLQGSYENILAFEKSLVSADAYLAAAEKGLMYGLRGVFDVLEAKTRMYNAQRKLNAEIFKNLKSQFELLYLIGKFEPSDVETYMTDPVAVVKGY